MLFWLKKTLTLLFLPLHFALFAGLSGTVLCFTRRETWGKRLLILSFVSLAFGANSGISHLLLTPLEHRFAPAPPATRWEELPPALQECSVVAVLGGGHSRNPQLSAINQLSTSSLSRLAEGVRIARLSDQTLLVVSGADVKGGRSHAQVLAQAAVALGFPQHRIVCLDTPRDTEDEAKELLRTAGSKPTALVTSAWHLPRAAGLCTKAGLKVVPCPADFLAKDASLSVGVWLTWDVHSLDRTTRALRERLGRIWATLRGKV